VLDQRVGLVLRTRDHHTDSGEVPAEWVRWRCHLALVRRSEQSRRS
jgi:hypothetical protein